VKYLPPPTARRRVLRGRLKNSPLRGDHLESGESHGPRLLHILSRTGESVSLLNVLNQQTNEDEIVTFPEGDSYECVVSQHLVG
jgi:hypothetical protein